MLFGCYKVRKGVYIKKGGWAWKAARRVIFKFLKCQANFILHFNLSKKVK